MVSTKTIDSFLERIAKDDSKQSVTNFRMSVPLMEGDYQFYKGIEQWQHVYPAAEFGKDESDNLVFKKSNGLLMLHFTNLTTGQDMEAARKAARLASFIATSNMADILADPSGNRRFLGVELTGPIDVSGRLNYEQLYAQAMHALEQGERPYFDASETAVIMQSNRQFEQVSPVKQCFQEFFEPTDDVEKGEYLTATAIFNILKQKIGSSLQITSLHRFGRELQNIDGLKSKRTKYGTAYLVVRK